MNQIEALQRMRNLGTPVIESRDVAALLRVSASNATTILRRLAAAEMIIHLSRGRSTLTRVIGIDVNHAVPNSQKPSA